MILPKESCISESFEEASYIVTEPLINDQMFNSFIKSFNELYGDGYDISVDPDYNVQLCVTNQLAICKNYNYIELSFDISEGWSCISIESFKNFYSIEGFVINDFVIIGKIMYIIYYNSKTTFKYKNTVSGEWKETVLYIYD